jgi:hypothetical protein
MTCCSTESSFLERRCSAITLGLSSYSRGSSRRQSRDAWEVEAGGFPGIHIIEATPKSSPCPSERLTHFAGKDHIKMRIRRKRHDDNSIDSITEYPDENNHQCCSDNTDNVDPHSNTPQSKTLVSSDNENQQPVIRRAPLASLSSFKMSSIECQESDEANGSVFEESCNDTDDDMDQFSTDSDEISLQSPPPPTTTAATLQNGTAKKRCEVCVFDVNNDKIAVGGDANVTSGGTIERHDDRVSPVIEKTSCSGCISSSASDKKSTSSECVTINLVNVKLENPPLQPSAPSSVILEMPTLAKLIESSPLEPVTIDPDPCVAGSSRRWSRETLF